MKMIKLSLVPLVVLALPLASIAASPLLAQEELKFSFQAGLSYGFDSLEKITKERKAGSLGFSYQSNIGDTKNACRFSLLWNSFPGTFDPAAGFETSLQSLQLSADLFFYSPLEDINFFLGLSANNYFARYSPEVSENGDPLQKGVAFDGTKLGARLGLDYRHSKKWSFDATFNLTEYGVIYRPKVGGVNPAWLQLSVRYHF
ncbi:MAG: outer membrane beta-barrel protein [Holophagales bacterium]|jgi:hypothetical protein|nr:outer membrane beta-barrel protein [Holophagales bacterium]